MAYSQRQLDSIFDELKSGKLFLTCGKHKYVAYKKSKGGVIPPKPNGCKECWQAYYYTVHCLTAPHLRYEALHELEEVINHVVEYVEKGKFDFKPDINPTITYEKDGFIDETGEYKPDIKLTDLEAN
jgi:hypothetical protein